MGCALSTEDNLYTASFYKAMENSAVFKGLPACTKASLTSDIFINNAIFRLSTLCEWELHDVFSVIQVRGMAIFCVTWIKRHDVIKAMFVNMDVKDMIFFYFTPGFIILAIVRVGAGNCMENTSLIK